MSGTFWPIWLCFYPRHPRGWRHFALDNDFLALAVSIHATLAGGDSASCRNFEREVCFYPRHPRGWRQRARHRNCAACKFLSTPPSRVATFYPPRRFCFALRFYPRHPRGWRRDRRRYRYHQEGFYPRHPRGWRLSSSSSVRAGSYVSIHATLAGGDFPPGFCSLNISRFYPRHPRGWRRRIRRHGRGP